MRSKQKTRSEVRSFEPVLTPRVNRYVRDRNQNFKRLAEDLRDAKRDPDGGGRERWIGQLHASAGAGKGGSVLGGRAGGGRPGREDCAGRLGWGGPGRHGHAAARFAAQPAAPG